MQALSLTPKTFAVLQSLVEHSGHLVTKAAILAAVWPETAVGEAVLKVCVRELRQALGDSAQAPRFIATVHRRGYRFIAPLNAADGRATTGEGGPQQEPAVVVARGPQETCPGVRQLVGREAALRQLHEGLERKPRHNLLYASSD